MSRCLGMVCAGVLLCATAGCTLDSLFLSLTGSSNRKEQTVALSVNQASAAIHATLGSKFEIMVTQSKDGEEVHLEGQTKQGKKFAFILQKQKSDVGERTVVAFEGEKEAEGLLWDAVFLAMTAGPQPQAQPQTQIQPVRESSSTPVMGQPVQRIQGLNR